MDYLAIKTIHILSATLLFGTGLGSAFYKWRADKSGDLATIAVTNKNVVLADWLFTTPTVVLQPATGIMLAYRQGYSLEEFWLLFSLMLFLTAGTCWLVVVCLQIKMRDVSRIALNSQTPLPAIYHRYAKIWFWLGVPAFFSIALVYGLMVAKPPMYQSLFEAL